MTRINLVPPAELEFRHLWAEYAELPRVFGYVRKLQEAGKVPADVAIPSQYTLGTGHLKFFYDKLGFLVKRQEALVAELQRRGERPNYTTPRDLLVGLDAHWLNDYEPTKLALVLSRKRIAERLEAMRKRGALPPK